MDGLERLLESMKQREGERDKEPECLLMLDGTAFLVDLSNEWIYEVTNPANFISFNDLDEDGREFRFIYDPQTRNRFKGDEDEQAERIDLKYITLKELKWMPAFGFVWSKPQENSYKIHR
jgi:hypothetical protein